MISFKKILYGALLGVSLLGLAACEEDTATSDHRQGMVAHYADSAASSEFAGKSMATSVRSGAAAPDSGAVEIEANNLAYSHSLSAKADREMVAPVVDLLSSYCQGLSGCVVMEASTSIGDYHAYGNFTARATRKNIRLLNEQLESSDDRVEITSRATTAEDLSGPIADAERRLSMLKTQRTQLERLQQRADADFNSLVMIGRELAQVQSNIESVERQRSNLRTRVDTEMWSLHITSNPREVSRLDPMKQAIKAVPENLSHATALAITFTSFVLPWVVVPIGLLVAWRIRRKRRRAR